MAEPGSAGGRCADLQGSEPSETTPVTPRTAYGAITQCAGCGRAWTGGVVWSGGMETENPQQNVTFPSNGSTSHGYLKLPDSGSGRAGKVGRLCLGADLPGSVLSACCLACLGRAMTVCILGPLEVRDDEGGPVAVVGRNSVHSWRCGCCAVEQRSGQRGHRSHFSCLRVHCVLVLSTV